MYDDEEDIKARRKKMMIIIGSVVGGLILLLIIIAILKPSGKKQEELKELNCELEVTGNIAPVNGIYTQPIEVGFKSITPISDSYPITKSTIGVSDNARNTNTYKISKSGTYKLHGYVTDEAGNKKVCDLEVTVDIGQPSCELEVKSGTLGSGEWYNTDIEVGFKNMSTNSDTSSIKYYYIDKLVQTEDGETLKPNITESKDSYTVTEDGEVGVIGYIVDSNGTEGSCTLIVKKDSTPPTCTLKVTKGTLNQNGQYTDSPVIGLNTVLDDLSEVESSGIGIEKNYTEKSYTVTQEGTTIVYGYVKDVAGNEGVCSIAINRPKTSTPSTPSQPSTPSEPSTPSQPSTPTTPSEPTQPTQPPETKKSLASVAKKGDYVNYSAGTWTETSAERPSSASDYSWGYTSGQSKNNGTKCRGKDDTGSAKNGWRVLGISGDKVILVSAGATECFYHARTSTSSAVNYMNQRAKTYVDGNYAESAQALDCSSLNGGCNDSTTFGTSDTIANIGVFYYLATSKSSETLWGVSAKGRLTGFSGWSNGLRPIIILKANVKVSGGSGAENNPWVLSW